MMRTGLAFAFAGVAGLSAMTQNASAATITVLNPSFESETLAAGAFGASTVPNWTGGQDLRPTTGSTSTQMFAATPDGLNVVNVFPGTANQATVSQILGTNLEANTTYTLNVYVGARNTGTSNVQFGGYNVSLAAGSTTLASITSADAGAILPTAGNYAQLTLTYTSGDTVDPNQPLKISLGATAPINTTVYRTLYDNVQLSSASSTPEPTCLAGLGLIGATLLRRRRR